MTSYWFSRGRGVLLNASGAGVWEEGLNCRAGRPPRSARHLAAVGRDVFRVRDSDSVIQRACLPDSRDVQAVAYFTREEAAGMLEPRITLVREDLDTGPNYRIAVGNHQAVAIFELARTRGTLRPVRLPCR